MRSKGSCTIARVKPLSRRKAWLDLRRSNGWTAFVRISRATVPRSRGSSSTGVPAEAAKIAWGLVFFWIIRGHAAEGLRWYEQILRLPSLPPAAESRALVGAAAMWYTQGELVRARTALTRALQLATDSATRT